MIRSLALGAAQRKKPEPDGLRLIGRDKSCNARPVDHLPLEVLEDEVPTVASSWLATCRSICEAQRIPP